MDKKITYLYFPKRHLINYIIYAHIQNIINYENINE